MAGQRKLAIPVGKSATLVRTTYTDGRVCSHSDGGYCVQDVNSAECYPLVPGDTLEIREDPEVVKVATIIREEAGDVLSDIDALELARKIVKR